MLVSNFAGVFTNGLGNGWSRVTSWSHLPTPRRAEKSRPSA